MNKTEQLTEAMKSIVSKIDKAQTALNDLSFACIQLKDSLPSLTEPDEPTVGIKATIKTHWDIANRIAEFTDTVLRTLNPGEYNFGYYCTKGRFIEVYRLLVKNIVGWGPDVVIAVELSIAVSKIKQILGSEGHTLAFREYLATKKMPIVTPKSEEEKLASICTPRGIAEAIALATNLELNVLVDRGYTSEPRIFYQIGYRTPIGKFMLVTEFHKYILDKIKTMSVADWMKVTIANIMEKTQGLKAVDDYQKSKAQSESNLRKYDHQTKR